MSQSWTKAHDSSKNTFWENYPSIASPIIDTELNRNEVSVDTVDDRVITLDTTKAEQSDLLQAFKDVSLDSTTGVITFTLFNNTTKTIDTLLEKIAINFDYDDNPSSPHYQNLVIELEDGTYKYIDMSALITQYEFTDSSCISWTIGNDGSVAANIIDGSITGAKLQPNYLADCLSAKSGAENAEADAIAKALVSEGWARGTQNGQPVTSGSPYYHDNAKYWKDQAEAIVDISLEGLSDVDINNVQDGQALVYDGVADKWVNAQASSSGHTIENASGSAMTSRSNLQFAGYLKTTDDSANDRTVVSDEPIPILLANYQALTDAQRSGNKYLITDVNGNIPSGSGIDDLADVEITSASNNQVLTYNSSMNKWVNANAQTSESGYVKIAESTANQTYVNHLTQLLTAYNALTNAQKLSAILVRGDDAIFTASSNAGKFLNIVYSSATYINQLDITNKKYHTASNSFTLNDSSTSTYSGTISLWAIQ